jgi:uncharacterized membrane protein (UPF0127 family)
MDRYRLVNDRTGDVVIDRLAMATAFVPRLVGLLGRRGLPPDQGLLFPDCKSIHMFMMLFAIDVIYVDRDMKVVKLVPNLKPWRLSACLSAWGVIEAAAGLLERKDVRVGDRLRTEPVD